MKCKNKGCILETMHKGRCLPAPRNQIVTTTPPKATYVHVVCNQCVTKDAEIEGLRNQLTAALKRADEWAKISVEVGQNERKKAKRDRAQYMKDYRKRPLSSAYTDELDDAARNKPPGIAYG